MRLSRRHGGRVRPGQDRNTDIGQAASRIDKRNPDPRTALAAAVSASTVTYAALSRMIGRPDGYLSRFVIDGCPKALRPEEHRSLAEFFGTDDRALGVRDLWAGR